MYFKDTPDTLNFCNVLLTLEKLIEISPARIVTICDMCKSDTCTILPETFKKLGWCPAGSVLPHGEKVSLYPSSDGVTIKMPYGVDVLHQTASHPIFSYWVG